MKVRRYRDGRLIRSRQWRRATLQSERDLVLRRLGGMLAAIDRFELMLRALRIAGSQVFAESVTSAAPAVGYSATEPVTDTDPDRREAWHLWDAAGQDEC